MINLGGLKVGSPVFDDGDMLSDKYGYTFENVNPPLSFSGVPEDAESLVVVVDDPDAMKPAGKIWDHWVVWNIEPDVGQIEEGKVPPGAVEGRNDFGERGYGGPNPPDGIHKYRFKVYALDKRLDISESSTKKDVEEAMKGHVLDDDQIIGSFGP